MRPPNYKDQEIPRCHNCIRYNWDGQWCHKYPPASISEMGICDDYKPNESTKMLQNHKLPKEDR